VHAHDVFAAIEVREYGVCTFSALS